MPVQFYLFLNNHAIGIVLFSNLRLSSNAISKSFKYFILFLEVKSSNLSVFVLLKSTFKIKLPVISCKFVIGES